MDRGFWNSTFLKVPGNSRAGRVVWIFRYFWDVVLFQSSSGGLTLSCTTKCAQPSSELLEGHLEMVLTHLMGPSLSGCADLWVLCSCCCVTPRKGCTVQAFYKLSAQLSTKAQPGGQSWADRVMRNVPLTSEYVDVILLAEMHQQKCKHKCSLILLQGFFFPFKEAWKCCKFGFEPSVSRVQNMGLTLNKIYMCT